MSSGLRFARTIATRPWRPKARPMNVPSDRWRQSLGWLTVGMLDGAGLGSLVGFAAVWFFTGCNLAASEQSGWTTAIGAAVGAVLGAVVGIVCARRRKALWPAARMSMILFGLG